jgi:hypothetical protein
MCGALISAPVTVVPCCEAVGVYTQLVVIVAEQ